MDQVEGLVPGNRLEGVLPAAAHALQRAGKPCGAVHEFRIGTRHLVADHAGRVRIGFRTAHTEDTDPIGLDRKAARIRAIQRADAGPCLDGIGDGHHDLSPAGPPFLRRLFIAASGYNPDVGDIGCIVRPLTRAFRRGVD